MSFAADVKKELTSLEVHREHAKAELAALIRMNGSLSLFNQRLILNVQTENAAIARRIYSLLKEHFNVRSELLVRRKMKLKKNNVYIVRLKQDTRRVLDELSIMENGVPTAQVSNDIIGDTQKMRSYLRGAFMAKGA
ncbi:DNA-binding protein WhiA, partial [Tetragenococcus halophilus]|uniref:DNA-binding protein WhiA n=1 Tax=Tetragenococcus halophilus TaxID=51669 RepID=UPI000CCC7DCB